MSSKESAIQTPSLIRDPAPYNLTSSPNPLHASVGRFFSGSRNAWLLDSNGSVYVFRSSSGECVSQLRLGRKGTRVSVSCSCELSSRAPPPNSTSDESLLVLAVHQDGSDGKTTLAVVDPRASKLLRAIEVPRTVSSLCGVSGESLQVAGAAFKLDCFSGIVAAGCVGGHVLMVDLALGVELSYQPSVLHPQRSEVIELRKTESISSSVTTARSNGRHACVDVLAPYHKKGQFYYCSRNSAKISEFPSKSLTITALHFVHQMESLLIGYSFGGFQVYNLVKMTIAHGCPCPKAQLSVTHFTYQEPENDPKNNVYLWVARGSPELVSSSQAVETKLTLYQVFFNGTIDNGGEIIYKDLQTCGPVFIYALTPNPIRPHPNQSRGSRMIMCQTVEMSRAGRGLDESHDETVPRSDLTVAVFVWGCGDSTHRDYIVGLFDLNQYYHSQVPKMLQWRMSGKRAGVLGCSYFTFYSLKTLLEGNTLLDAAVSDVSPFFSLPPVPETHMWPTALSFDVTAITSEGFLKCTCLGLQRRALEELRLGGVATFSCPQGVFGMCERADLLGPAWDLDHSSIEVQQKTLLSVALEHHMTSLLKSCAHVWMDGGCGTGFSVFVDWIRQKLEDGLKEKDRLCNRLFSGSAGPVDKSSSLLLAHLQSIFHHLSRLLTSILTPLTSSPLPPDDPVISELSGFYVTASNCHAITQVVIWCVRNGLLPVATVSYGCYFVYPASALSRLCDRMRTQICPCKLALDYLCDDLQCDYHYPPDKMEGLLSIFTTTNTLSQHCLMMYFLCDISNLDGVGFDQDTLLHSYSSQFNPTNPLTSLVRGLWALDHSHYQMALTNLIGRQLGPVQWLPWLHSGVLSLLLRAPDPCLALTYIDAYKDFLSGPEDLKLRLNVLVRCHCVSDAINLLKPYEDSEDIEEYFSHFLDLCFQHQCLSKLVNLPLNEFEDAYFCQYLEDSPSLKAQELLVMHHLAHHRYSNAIATQKKIRPLAMADPDPDTRERSQFRDSLLEGFNRCIPSVLQEADKVLAGEREVSSQFKPQAGAKNPPLSLVLAKNAATRTKSAADEIFQALQHIAQAREVSAEPYSPFRQKSDGAVPHTPFFSPPPSVRKAMSSRRKCPVVQATPISRPPTSGHVSIPDHPPSSGVSFLSTYMENFKLRMLQMSQTAATIDTSLIKTPSLKPMESESVNVSTTQPPPSILKVKQPSGGVRSDDVRSEGVRGDEEEEYKSTPAPITRKIRFAVEGTPLVSPVSSLLPQSQPPESVPAPDTTSAVSTAPTSIALETPLPSSDDSDLYYSFTEPSSSTPPLLTELTPAHPPQGTPSQSPLPKTQLFIGAIEDYEDEEQQQQDGKQDGKQDEPDSQMDTESGASVQSDSLQQSHDREHAMATEKKTVVTKDVSVAMATQKIRFHDARSLLGSGSKATPTKGVAGGLFAPSRPSPLSHSITSHSSPLVSTSTSVSKTQKSIFALEMANEMVGAKKDRLSLESMRRKAINQISSSPQSTQKDSAQQKTLGVAVSATMVQVPISDIPRQGPGGPGAYRFSPGKILSTPPVDQLKSPEPAFVFSPPLTRSAARRKAAASRMAQESGDAHHRDGGGERGGITGETECAGERERRRDEGRDMGGDAISAKLTFESAPPEPHSPAHGLSVSGGHDEGDSTSGGRHKQPMKTTRSHGSRTTVAGLHIELDRVNLVSPPSLQTTPTTTPRRGQRSRQQVTRPVRAMATRRSTRLLQDKKNF